jgi:hypothetical protein
MTLPGFSAEAALDRTQERYWLRSGSGALGNASVIPAFHHIVIWSGNTGYCCRCTDDGESNCACYPCMSG